MKPFFTIAVAGALAACVGTHAWSQGGQSGGGGTSGAAGASGSTGTSGTAGTSGTSATTGTAGTAGTSGSAGTTAGTTGTSTTGAAGTSGAAGTAGTSGTAGATGKVGVGQTQAGANVSGQVDTSAQLNRNRSGMNQTPFFADPRVRQELRLTDQQFNALNRAHQNALRSLNQNQTVTGQGTGTAASQRARNLQEFQTRQNTNVGGTAGTDTAAQQRAARLQEFQNRFNLDNQTVDATLTDPALRQRFNQLNWQFRGLSAFLDPTIQRQLNLTSEQQRHLMRLNTEFRRDFNQLLRTARTDPTLEQQVLDLRSQFLTQANALLTPEQQQLWAQLTGQPFQFSGQVFLPTTNATGSVQVGAQQRAADQSGTSQAPQTRRRVR